MEYIIVVKLSLEIKEKKMILELRIIEILSLLISLVISIIVIIKFMTKRVIRIIENIEKVNAIRKNRWKYETINARGTTKAHADVCCVGK